MVFDERPAELVFKHHLLTKKYLAELEACSSLEAKLLVIAKLRESHDALVRDLEKIPANQQEND